MFKRGRWNLIGFKCDRFLRDAIERGTEKTCMNAISEYIRLAVEERLQIDGIRVGSANHPPEPLYAALRSPADGEDQPIQQCLAESEGKTGAAVNSEVKPKNTVRPRKSKKTSMPPAGMQESAGRIRKRQKKGDAQS